MGPTSTAPGAIEIASLAAAGGLPEKGSAWIRGPIWDGFWMLSALWLAPIVLWLASGWANPESSPLDVLYFGLTALFWLGHRFCSTYLAYCTEAYRPLLRSQPVRFVVIPLLITIGCFAFFLPPDEAMPWSRAERLVFLAIVDYAWVTWHFASQHFGALSLYRSRAGRARCEQTRRFDRFFALAVGGALVFLADVLAGAVAYQDKWIDQWFFPTWMVSAQDQIRDGGTLVLVLVTVAVLFAEVRTSRWSWPRVLYILGIAVMVGIALQPRSLFLFVVVWTSQHWIVATGLASQTVRGEPAPQRGRIRGLLHGLNIRPWAIVLFLAVVSVLLLPIFEVEANRQPDAYYGDRIFGAIATGLRTSSWVPILVALGFASGFIHYLLDRNVYRMSDPQVRQAARGLLERRMKSSNVVS
ncbi:MAG TPA: hypothetical protein VJU77_10445 [Chthoniobacterales bacterium]|nr:hypothetical protein [Chthoniobacterales bacterium]